MKNLIHTVLAAGPALAFGLNTGHKYLEYIKENKITDPESAISHFYKRLDSLVKDVKNTPYTEIMTLRSRFILDFAEIDYDWAKMFFGGIYAVDFIVEDIGTGGFVKLPFFMKEIIESSSHLENGNLIFKTGNAVVLEGKIIYKQSELVQIVPLGFENGVLVNIANFEAITYKVKTCKDLQSFPSLGDNGTSFVIFAKNSTDATKIYLKVSKNH